MRWFLPAQRLMRSQIFLAVAAALLILSSTSLVFASVNLPLHHWAYEAIERLTALGIIDRAMVVPKPYSRKQAAKYVVRALDRVRTNEIGRASCRERV